jgi:hypothetical protein
VSISSTFYSADFFLYEIVLAAFRYLQFGLVVFCSKDIGTKATHKILIKSTSGVNFINTLLAAFSFESERHNFLYLHFIRLSKSCLLNVETIDCRKIFVGKVTKELLSLMDVSLFCYFLYLD